MKNKKGWESNSVQRAWNESPVVPQKARRMAELQGIEGVSFKETSNWCLKSCYRPAVTGLKGATSNVTAAACCGTHIQPLLAPQCLTSALSDLAGGAFWFLLVSQALSHNGGPHFYWWIQKSNLQLSFKTYMVRNLAGPGKGILL